VELKLGCNKGSATLETAVMFLILIIMVTGFIFLINAVTVYSVAQTAAREGAREYAITDNASKAARKAKDELSIGGIEPSSAKVTTESAGRERRVKVTIDYPIYIPLIGKSDIQIQGGAVFRSIK
jgi:Flp pilus assembly protein TadG